MQEHKKHVKEVFDRASLEYGEKGCSFFNDFGKRLVELASPLPGESILDVATGKGAVLLPAAERVGPQGSAIGIDLSPKMLEASKTKIPFPWVQWEEMDAESLSFPNHTFDKVFCAFGLFFFPHIQQALSEFKRVLQSTGLLAVSTFGKKSTLDEWLSSQIEGLGLFAKLSTLKLDTAPLLKEHLMRAGFSQMEIYEEENTCFYENGATWWDSLWTRAIRFRLEQLSPHQLEAIKQKALAYAGKGQVSEERPVIYAIAKISKKIGDFV